jgi:uncharacterized membrane protein YphA (DoxX/SURF4 family)
VDLKDVDRRISGCMRHYGHGALRFTLAVIFVWFGILKPLGISPAEALVLQTVDWMPLLPATTWLAIIGWWEVAIGVLFLFRPTLRFAIALLAMQMVGTFMPLVILPDVTFQPGRVPYGLTLEGQYIIKNILIISAAMVIGGTVTKERPGDRA